MEENKESHSQSNEGKTPTHNEPKKEVEHPNPVHTSQSKSTGTPFFKNHLWKITTGILAIALIISFLPGFGGGISASEAGNKAITAINSELQGQATASLLSVQEQNGLYNARINVQGQILDTYITKDGALLFTQAIPIDNVDGSGPSTIGTGNSGTGNVVRRDVNSEDAYFLGDEDAPVTIIEFSDFQCPFCKRFFDQTKPQLEKEYIETGKVKFVYMHFPLSSIHPDAEPAALASECAGEQGKFWEYHDLLFENQRSLSETDLKQYAADLGLNEDQFNNCLDSGKYQDKVDSDFNQGSSNGISGTPGFLINGRPLSGAQPFSAFQNIIEQELGNAPLQGATGNVAAQPSAGGCGIQPTGGSPTVQQTGPVDVDIEGAFSLGNPDATVTIVEFSDFQCPFCKRFFDQSLEQLKNEFIDTGKVLFVYKHFPLSFHAQAENAALASECAGEQDKFLEYHDLIFQNQGSLSDSIYSQWANDLGLDTTQFDDCYNSGKYLDKIRKDFSDGQGYGVSGTPTFFINGNKLVGAQPYSTIKATIEAEL